MDTQLACATFATVLPVLLVAGYLAPDFVKFARTRRLRSLILYYTAVAWLGECASLTGVWTPHRIWALIGLIITMSISSGLLVIPLIGFVESRYYETDRPPKARDDHQHPEPPGSAHSSTP